MKKSSTSSSHSMQAAIRLKKLREQLGFSQRELSKEFKVTPGAIALWESGKRPIPGPILLLIDIFEQEVRPADKSNTSEELMQISHELSNRVLSIELRNRKRPIQTLRTSLENGIQTYFND